MLFSHIFHEQQVSALCGRHAVNNLLQGPYVTEIDLAQIAQDLDEIEQNLMLQDRGIGGEPTANALRFVAEFESSNVDDSGNFSVTVLKEALTRFGNVELTTERDEIERALRDPTDPSVEAFLLNHDAHWLSIRRIKISGGSATGTWLNLNSTLKAPEVVTDFFLREWLFQLRADGYTVFLVKGKLPAPLIGHSARDAPNCWHESLKVISSKGESAASRKAAELAAKSLAAEDPDYRRALEMSLAEYGDGSGIIYANGDGGGSGGTRSQKRGASLISSRNKKEDDEDDLVFQQVLAESLSQYTADDDHDLKEALALSLGSESPSEIIMRLKSSLPEEPSDAMNDCVRIAIRLPPSSSPFDGVSASLSSSIKTSFTRRFLATSLVSDVFDFALLSWIEAFLPTVNANRKLATPMRSFSLNMSGLTGPAKKFMRDGDCSITLKNAGLAPSAALQLRPIEM
jgi:ataxin-3